MTPINMNTMKTWESVTLERWQSALTAKFDETAFVDAVNNLYRLAGMSQRPYFLIGGSPREAQKKIDGLRTGQTRGNPNMLKERTARIFKIWSPLQQKLGSQIDSTFRTATADLRASCGLWANDSVGFGTTRSVDNSIDFVATWPLYPNVCKPLKPHFFPFREDFGRERSLMNLVGELKPRNGMSAAHVEDMEFACAYEVVASCGVWMAWFYEGVVVAAMNPTLRFDRTPIITIISDSLLMRADTSADPRRVQGFRLHNQAGPAVLFPDGQKSYYWRGVQVPEEAITRPLSIDAKKVVGERNMELRRALMECLGWDRILNEVGAKVVGRDDFGELLEAPLGDDGMQEAKFVRVKDASSDRIYVLRVDPKVKTPREGLATSVGLEVKDYVFGKQT